MQFLADVNVEKGIVYYLLENGYNVKWVPDLDCKIKDEKLLDLAHHEKRIIITNDKDFGDLIFRKRRASSGIILFRVKGKSTKPKVHLLGLLLNNYKNKLENHFTVITRKKFRFISMEDVR